MPADDLEALRAFRSALYGWFHPAGTLWWRLSMPY
jgi:hypothetical protein